MFRFLICSCNCFSWFVTCDTLVVLEVATINYYYVTLHYKEHDCSQFIC